MSENKRTDVVKNILLGRRTVYTCKKKGRMITDVLQIPVFFNDEACQKERVIDNINIKICLFLFNCR